MQRRPPAEARPEIVYLQMLTQVFAKLVHAVRDRLIAPEHLCEMILHHAYAGATRGDDCLILIEYTDKMLGDPPGLIVITAVERWLTATGLARIKFARHSALFKHRDHGPANLGKELIHIARDEQPDSSSFNIVSRCNYGITSFTDTDFW
jgi:hypothetical protein